MTDSTASESHCGKAFRSSDSLTAGSSSVVATCFRNSSISAVLSVFNQVTIGQSADVHQHRAPGQPDAETRKAHAAAARFNPIHHVQVNGDGDRRAAAVAVMLDDIVRHLVVR